MRFDGGRCGARGAVRDDDTKVEFSGGNSLCLTSPSVGSEGARVRALVVRLLHKGAHARVGMAPPSCTLNESLWRQPKSVCVESNGKVWVDGEKLRKVSGFAGGCEVLLIWRAGAESEGAQSVLVPERRSALAVYIDGTERCRFDDVPPEYHFSVSGRDGTLFEIDTAKSDAAQRSAEVAERVATERPRAAERVLDRALPGWFGGDGSQGALGV